MHLDSSCTTRLNELAQGSNTHNASVSSLCLRNSTCPPPTATTTTETTVTASSSTQTVLVVPTGVVALDCAGLGANQVMTLGSQSWTFSVSCETDYVGNDFGGIIAYSFHDCLMACAAHNYFSGSNVCEYFLNLLRLFILCPCAEITRCTVSVLPVIN